MPARRVPEVRTSHLRRLRSPRRAGSRKRPAGGAVPVPRGARQEPGRVGAAFVAPGSAGKIARGPAASITDRTREAPHRGGAGSPRTSGAGRGPGRTDEAASSPRCVRTPRWLAPSPPGHTGRKGQRCGRRSSEAGRGQDRDLTTGTPASRIDGGGSGETPPDMSLHTTGRLLLRHATHFNRRASRMAA